MNQKGKGKRERTHSRRKWKFLVSFSLFAGLNLRMLEISSRWIDGSIRREGREKRQETGSPLMYNKRDIMH